MLSPKLPRVLRCVLIGLIPAAALVIGCPFGDQTGSNGDPPGPQPTPPEDIVLEVMIEGQGTVEQEADGSFVTLTALPDAGWYFQRWFGTTASKYNPLTVQATEDTSIGALFLEIEPPVTPVCGDDAVNQGSETCDGTDVGDAACTFCRAPGAAGECTCCGDGSVNGGEECDDGNKVAGDGCENDCTVTAVCGDDVVNRGSETCDGTDMGSTACTSCRAPGVAARCTCCGDGVVNGGEECDDGNKVADDGCENDCTLLPVCGDNTVNRESETCDGTDMGNTACTSCRASGTTNECTCCGDDEVNGDEDCDPPDTSTCDSTCKFIPPDNDDCDDAIDIGDGSQSFSNERASTDGPNEPDLCDFSGYTQVGADVWFCYEATCNGDLTVDLCDSNYDTKVAVYTGCTCPTAVPSACNDDVCGESANRSKLTSDASIGTKYLIRIGGFNGVQGAGTLVMTCAAGGCQNHADCDDDDDCTDDTCDNGSCVNTPIDCDDGDACTDDTCEAGQCTNPPTDCDDGDLCTIDSCDSATGCFVEPRVCDDDGVFCNGVEECDSATGLCVSAGDPCAQGENCDEANDECRPACTTDADCDDDVWCNGLETCPVDTCQPGTAVDCDDGVGCTEDSCNENTDSCDNVANDANCDDGQFCNGSETCDAVNDCQPGTAEDCDDSVDCTDDSCNTGTDSCDNIADDAYCDDGLWCNGAETCDAQAGCQAGGNPCPGRYCNEDTDTCYDCELHWECDDGLFCNGAETCVDGFCHAGADPCPGQECNENYDHCVIVCTSNADCDDGLFCNGEEVCIYPECWGLDPPCVDVAHCDEENDRCLNCISVDECDDGDLCTDDACIQNECQNIDVQCAPDVCNPDTGECVDCLVDGHCNDGAFCNGEETCSPTLVCQPGDEDLCDDGIGCTIDDCDEANDLCVNAASDARCPDDLLWCNGEEYCNPVSDCTHLGNPCQVDEICNEAAERCEVEPATWVSTQILFPGSPGYKAPERYELDDVRDLVVAHLGLSEATLRWTWPDATIEVFATDVPLGVETDMYRVVDDIGGGYTETIVQTVTINAFHLSITGSTATWEFDYVVVNDVENPFGLSVTSGQFVGEQTGEITGARDEITWTGVDGTFQRCEVRGDCQTPTPLDWMLGTWTKE
ncbi:MAG: hypothetical protein JSU86_14375 [Phycisphaerales bacterium]|nr:MAG: hypothetical protein JSU86_14375 [Phycisphaerales bacterium]